MDLSEIGSAGWEQQSGATLSATADGSVTLERVYQGPKDTLDAFLSTIPEGEPDAMRPELARTKEYKATFGDSYGRVILTFSGQSAFSGATSPAKVSKGRVTRTVHIKNETVEGDVIEASIPNGAAAYLAIQYGTALHSVEYVSYSPGDSPSQEDAADLPANLNNAVRLLDASPAVTLLATEYLGGGFQAPDGLDAKIGSTDYKVVAACVNYERTSDGSLWKCREDWVALVEDETA